MNNHDKPLVILQKFLAAKVSPGTPCFCGFSGGCDSTALLLALQLLKAPVTAVHFHHGLRGKDADADERWCRDFCQEHEVPFLSRHLDVHANCRPGESLEEAGRRLRLQAWQSLALHSEPILLAHHADDCLENLFLRLARGSNSSGLTGLREETHLLGLRFLRPFLPLRKAELALFLRAHLCQGWREDLSNDDNVFRRNAIRNLLLPLWRDKFGDDLGLLRSLKALQDDADLLGDLAAKSAEHLDSLAAWRQIPPALLPRVLHLWLEKQGLWCVPSHGTVNQLATMLASFHGETREIQLGDGLTLRLDQRGISIPPSPPTQSPTPEPRPWNWVDEPVLNWPGWGRLQATITTQDDEAPGEAFLLASIPPVLLVRPWFPGDALRPFGAKFTRKLQDIFSDAKIPREQRTVWPVIEAEGKIIWLPDLKRAEFGRCAPGDQIVKLHYRKEL